MEIIAVVNQKGGVAKTTTAINLGSALAARGRKILLVDVDPQANLTSGVGFEKKEKSTYKIMKGEIDLGEAIYETGLGKDNWGGSIDLIPSDIDLANAELEFSGEIGRETILKEAFDNSRSKVKEAGYDYIILDTNPSLGLLTVNAISMADNLIIPLEASMFALNGMEQLTNVIKLVKKKLNNKLKIKGVLLTRVDGRTNIAEDFYSELKDVFGDKLFDTVIHQNVKLTEAQTEGLPINLFDKKARGAKEYAKLAEELISHERG